MATYYSPKIATNGLILYLDAGNTKSYIGSGTAWSDLSGYSLNGTLTNGPTFDSSNGGSISYDGVDDYVLVNSNSLFSVTAMTMLMFIKTPSSYTGNFRAFFSKQGADRDFNFYAYSSAGTGVINYYHMSSARLTSYDSTAPMPNGVLALNTWHQVGFSIGGGNLTYYLNGAVLQRSAYSGTFNANNAYNLSVGSADNYWSGKIANTAFYNRVITDAEVLQNYNAGKSRFGL